MTTEHMYTTRQQPDDRPGPYYVSAIDGARLHLMAGPYESHADALADVDRALDIAGEYDGRAFFAAWGTVRDPGNDEPGKLNRLRLI